jgi:hypothetical protein
MSRIYFHSPSGDAGLSGAEREWLASLARGPAKTAWDLDGLDAASRVLAMVPQEGADSPTYLHRYLADAEATRQFADIQTLLTSLKVAMRVHDMALVVHGVRLMVVDVDYNTALVAGADPVALATKIHGWSEIHTWVEGPDRAWFADIIERALAAGLYRRGMGWERPFSEDDGPGVVPLLRARDDEPVVLSRSYGDPFPRPEIAGWTQPAQREEWHRLSGEEKWRIAMAAHRESGQWCRLSPDTLRTSFFSSPITAYDLTNPDRAEYVRDVLRAENGEADL